MSEENDILQQALNECGFQSDPDCTIEQFRDELDHVNEVYEKTKEAKEDLEFELTMLKRKYEESAQKIRDRIKEIEETDDENYNYREHRERILHQVEVIEYRKLNPNLDIS